MNKKDNIIKFLQKKPGYRKENPNRLQKVIDKQLNIRSTYNECDEALKEFRKEFKNKNKSTNEVKENFDITSKDTLYEKHLKDLGITKSDVKSVKHWQTIKGEARFSVVTKNENKVESNLDLDKFNIYLDKYPTPSELLYELSTVSNTGVHCIADLHIGSFVKNMILTPDYNISIIKSRLELTAKLINSEYNKENYIFIMGDLFESITGLNHINSWKQLELYGTDAMIAAFELIRYFLLQIKNLKGVYVVGGNHDRLTSNSQEDTSADGAKLVAYFLKRDFPTIDFEFSDVVISKTIDNINYIATHGHLGLSNKTIEALLLNYAPKNNNYNVALSAHLHSRKKKELIGDSIFGDSVKYSGYVVPSVFTGNDWSEKAGFTSTSGYMSFQNMFNIPKVSYIPLK